MFRTTGKNDGAPSSAKRPASGGLRRSVTSLWATCSKHASRTSRKLANNSSPRKLMSTVSHKVIQFRHKKRVGEEFDGEARKGGGVWQRTILMGDKCQPLDFSGVIYYDSDGNQVDELPMRYSPRARNGGGVWQRTILMGDKCQPLDFSGVIYYDSDGNQVDELPMRSPRARPVPSYAYKSENSRRGW